MTSLTNSCSLNFQGFFVPFRQPQFPYMQLQQIRPLDMDPNEEKLLKEMAALRINDGKGKWTFDQQKQYLLFLHENIEQMREKSSRKSKKVFLKMSFKVKTRTADQCRSHHQKILKYHHSLQQIIRYYSEEVYSFEKIFGKECSKKQKSIQNAKTGIEEQTSQELKFWVEGSRVKILLNSDLISDY